ncbi:hypothetical protein [Allomuricauda sp. d1]|uniref:YciI family protein n=1 Tax=Allomuricauda sp. d1 TaxID=3136725 RepID=UPI0031DB9518
MRLLLFLSIPFLVIGQQTPEKKEQLFIALYTVGKNWDAEKPPNEQTHFKEHSSFLQQLRSDKSIAMGARYGDTGMVIFKAMDLESAKMLINSDIAVQNQLFDVEVHAFAPFYKGCIE